MADNTTKILLLVVILVVLGYAYKQNSGTGIIGISGEPAEKAAEKIVDRDCSGTEYIVQKPCSRNGVVLDGLTDETSGAGFETHVLDKNHEGFVRQLGDGVCPPKLVECNVDPPKPCSGNTWLDALCVRLDADGNEVILEDGNADRCGDGILKQTLDTSAADYQPATKGGLCTFERSGACQKTCPEPQPPVCNYPVLGWQYNDLGCVKSQDDLTPVGCGESGVIQRYKASTMNTEYCKNLTEWVSCSMKPCPQDCEGSWSDWTPNPDACDVQPSESRIYSINKPAVGNTQFGYGRPCEEIHDKVETRSRQDPIQPCCTQSHNWTGPIGGVCSPRGTGKFIQTTEGQCAEDIKSQIKPCCYETGDWEDIDSTCLPTGKKRQKQTTTTACRPGTEIREVDCCYTTKWEDVGKCNSNGEQPQSRIVAGSCNSVPLEEDKETCDSELARLKMIQTKEGVKGVRYIWYGFDNKTEYLNIGQIEVYSDGVNIVKNIDDSKVTVNSEYGDGTNYRKNQLFDGNYISMYHSAGKPNDWIKIDLGKEYTIDAIKIFNRHTCGNGVCDDRWSGSYVKLLNSSGNEIERTERVVGDHKENGERVKTYSFAVNPDTLAKLEGIMDVVPADFSEISDFHWKKIIPACELTRVSDESNSNRTVPCHYVGSWEAWGSCNGQHKYRQRKVVNSHLVHPDHGTNTPSTEQGNCKNCKGVWKQEYESLHGRSHRRNRHKRHDWQKFYKTQNADGGGHCSGLPSHGDTRHTDYGNPCGGATGASQGKCGSRYASWKWMEANYNNGHVVSTVHSSG